MTPPSDSERAREIAEVHLAYLAPDWRENVRKAIAAALAAVRAEHNVKECEDAFAEQNARLTQALLDLEQARAEGREEGLLEAVRLCDHQPNLHGGTLAHQIRALQRGGREL